MAQGDFGAATACPATFENIIVVPGFEKDVWGFDVVIGQHLWTFHTVPHPGEFGYETWDQPESYGANCWGGMAMDEVRGIAYLTTGSAKPNFVGVTHVGQNLFANCLVALDAHTGQPVFPFRLRRAPTSPLRGERTSPYQPDPELPERFSKMLFTEEDLTQRSEESAEFAISRFKSATTGFFQPCTEGRANLFFGIDGGAEWTGACIDVDSGRLYVTANHVGWIISVFRDDDPPEDPNAPHKTSGRLVYEQTCLPCHGPTRLGLSTCDRGHGWEQVGNTLRRCLQGICLAGERVEPAFKVRSPGLSRR